ncbi:helix-turn-helix transcriptional regulator [Nocardia acidivorans]|uniref:helix-turn-helix transcriptional regulator n=1 Tax=Nocardia acidivorans TaxID=404580 RepID=UPI0008357B40|nr:hypothetical protein [Nocardia acidivorans]
MSATDPDTWWTAQQCADYIDVKLRTWHAYVNRPTATNPAPKPIKKIGSTPVWDSDEVIAWNGLRTGGPIN